MNTPLWSKTLIAVVAATAILAGCAGLSGLVQRPRATFERLAITNASLLEGTLVFTFKVDNPNPVGLHTGRIGYDLAINGRRFVSDQIQQGIHLPANGTGHLQIPITVAYLDALTSVSEFVRNHSADYDLNATLAFGPLTIPLHARGSFELPRPPAVHLTGLKVSRLSPLGAGLECQIRIDNPNDFPLRLNRLHYVLNINGQKLVQTSAQTTARKGRTRMVESRLDVSFAQLGTSIYRILSAHRVDYELNGRLIVDTPTGRHRELPFTRRGRVPVGR